MNWQIGDRVMIVKSQLPERVGMHVTIVSSLCVHNPENGRPWAKGAACYLIDIPSMWNSNRYAGYSPEHLGPIPDSYDGLSVTTWDECPIEFHPDNFKVTVT